MSFCKFSADQSDVIGIDGIKDERDLKEDVKVVGGENENEDARGVAGASSSSFRTGSNKSSQDSAGEET